MGRNSISSRPQKSFAALERRIKNVPAAAVRKKWKKLSTYSQENIHDILTSVSKQGNEGVKTGKRKLMNTESVVNEVATRLSERLPRMPFPPATHNDSFDFELTLHRVQSLEQQLTDHVHSTNLLRAQIRKEEQSYSGDREELKQLQESLASSDALRKQQNKNLHPLVRAISRPSGSDMDHINRSEIQPTPSSFTSDWDELVNDPELSPTIRHMRNHLDSMQNNTADMQTVVGCIKEISHRLHTFESRAVRTKTNIQTT